MDVDFVWKSSCVRVMFCVEVKLCGSHVFDVLRGRRVLF